MEGGMRLRIDGSALSTRNDKVPSQVLLRPNPTEFTKDQNSTKRPNPTKSDQVQPKRTKSDQICPKIKIRPNLAEYPAVGFDRSNFWEGTNDTDHLAN